MTDSGRLTGSRERSQSSLSSPVGFDPGRTLDECTQIVKRAIRASAVHLCWPAPGIMDAIKEQEAAKQAVVALPALEVSSHPFYQSVDEGQSGFVLAAHLTEEQMLAVPLHITTEMLDELATGAGGACHDSPRDYQRNQVLAAYGAELAELICQGIDEALESSSEGYKRLIDYSGKLAALASTELDEPRYDPCGPDDEFASPTTSFDFWEAIEAARELIEERDKAAALARRGITPPSEPTEK